MSEQQRVRKRGGEPGERPVADGVPETAGATAAIPVAGLLRAEPQLGPPPTEPTIRRLLMGGHRKPVVAEQPHYNNVEQEEPGGGHYNNPDEAEPAGGHYNNPDEGQEPQQPVYAQYETEPAGGHYNNPDEAEPAGGHYNNPDEAAQKVDHFNNVELPAQPASPPGWARASAGNPRGGLALGRHRGRNSEYANTPAGAARPNGPTLYANNPNAAPSPLAQSGPVQPQQNALAAQQPALVAPVAQGLTPEEIQQRNAALPKNGRRARNQAKLKSEYAGEKGSKRHDMGQRIEEKVDFIKKLAGWIVALQNPALTDQELAAIKAAMPAGATAKAVAGLDRAASLEKLKERYADQREFCKRQDIPIDDKDDLGNLDDRKVEYDETPEQQEQSRIEISGGKLKRSGGEPVDTSKSSTWFSGNGVEIFVVGPKGDIHMASHKIGKYHHSSLLAGTNVSMGGELKVTGGTIDWVSAKSGHYAPSMENLVQFLHYLEKDGVPLTFTINGGFGAIPTGVTAESVLHGNGDAYGQAKTKALWEALEAEFGIQVVNDAVKAQGWQHDRLTGEVKDQQHKDVPLRDVRRMLKAKFGTRGKAKVVEHGVSQPTFQ
jgi:hypothetical protein